MFSLRILVVGMAGLGLVGCSSIVQGTDQEIAINTNPWARTAPWSARARKSPSSPARRDR